MCLGMQTRQNFEFQRKGKKRDKYLCTEQDFLVRKNERIDELNSCEWADADADTQIGRCRCVSIENRLGDGLDPAGEIGRGRPPMTLEREVPPRPIRDELMGVGVYNYRWKKAGFRCRAVGMLKASGI